VRRWLFILCSFCFWDYAFSQRQKVYLESGTYRFQEFTGGVVLADSGRNYRFEHCHFLIHQNDTGLKANNQNSIKMVDCQFKTIEQGKGIGMVVSNAHCEIRKCNFLGLGKALVIQPREAKSSRIEKSGFKANRIGIYFHSFSEGKQGLIYPLTILQNNFSGNQTAINLDASGPSSPTDLTLKCNRFDIDNSNYSLPFYGVVLGANHRIANHRIGGNGLEEHNWRTPGANVWPIQGSPNRAIRPCNDPDVEYICQNGWQSPFVQGFGPTWYSVQNNSTQPVKMYRYLNEFVGRVDGAVEKDNVENLCYTDANLAIVPPFNPGQNDVHECEEGIPNPTVVVFPTRMAVDSTGSQTTIIKSMDNQENNSLGQNVPNPGSTEVLIAYQLVATSQSATLRIAQLSSGRTFEPISLSKESNEIRLDISDYPAGVYAYSLFVDGSPVQTRKLVVVR
jgi:hypothetical protein